MSNVVFPEEGLAHEQVVHAKLRDLFGKNAPFGRTVSLFLDVPAGQEAPIMAIFEHAIAEEKRGGAVNPPSMEDNGGGELILHCTNMQSAQRVLERAEPALRKLLVRPEPSRSAVERYVRPDDGAARGR